MQSNIKLAVLLTIFAAIAYSVMSVLVKIVTPDVATSVILFMRFIVGMMVLIPFNLIRGNKLVFKTKRPWLHLVRGIAGVATLGLYYYSLKHISLVDAALLNNTFPLFMPLIAWLSLGIKSSKSLIVAVLIGFVGVIFVLNPTHGSEHGFFQWAAIMALLSGFAMAVSLLSIRLLSKTEDKFTIMFYFFVISLIVSGLFSINAWHKLPLNTWLLLILLGLIASLYQNALTRALSNAPARIVSPLMYLSLIFSGFFEWAIWGHTPDLSSIIGIVLVVISAIATILLGGRKEV